MNILIITIDTLRYDYVGYSRNYRDSFTPVLDEVSREGLTYKFAFSSGTSTPFSFPGILSSVYSMQSKKLGVKGSPLTFAEYLKEKDYFTLGFNGGNIYVSNLYDYDRGLDYLFKSFSRSESSGKKKKLKKILKNLHLYNLVIKLFNYKTKIDNLKKVLLNKPVIYRAQDQIRDFLDIVKENRHKKFFAFINFMEVHGPYLGLWKESLKERFLIDKLTRERMLQDKFELLELNKYLYIRGLQLVDQQIGYLLNSLDTMGILEDTLVVITSDHGEEFLEHGNYDHLPKPYDELIRVPLIIMVKNERFSLEEKNLESEKLVSLVDLVPSISRYLFRKIPKEFVGKDTILGGKEYRKYVYSEGYRIKNGIRHDATKKGTHNWCIRTKKVKYMELDGKKYLFNLENDSGEQEPVIINNKEELSSEMRDYIKAFNREILQYKVKTRT
ncbi:MAG: sulfatase [Thermosipho sp. (in: Bacteria)]|nr:sulfatase [Thermosipho sp. (in: thermotogales)]